MCKICTHHSGWCDGWQNPNQELSENENKLEKVTALIAAMRNQRSDLLAKNSKQQLAHSLIRQTRNANNCHFRLKI